MEPSLPAPPVEWRPTAVVFDCDGVLMDTEAAWARVQHRVCDHFGVDFDAAARRSLMGLSARDVTRWITDRAADAAATRGGPAPTVDEVGQRLASTEDTVVSAALEPLPGAVETVRAFAERMPVAVASNSTAGVLERKMRAVGLDRVLTTWVSSDDVPHGKPAPDIYREAVRRLGARPEDTLAVEDSPAGATAAVTAGLWVLAVPYGHEEPVPSHLLATSLADPLVREFMTGWGVGERSASSAPGTSDAPPPAAGRETGRAVDGAGT